MSAGPVPVLLVGEGNNELGVDPDWNGGRSARKAGHGFIGAMLEKVAPSAWTVIARRRWKDAPKLRVGSGVKGGSHPERRAVDAFVNDAKEVNAHLVFLRDSDGDVGRAQAIAQAVADARQREPAVRVAGGVPHPKLEGWILALQGRSGTEAMTRNAVDAALEKAGVDSKDTQAYVEIVSDADLGSLPPDANALRVWLTRILVLTHDVL